MEDGQYIVMTIRTHDQLSTVVYGLDNRYRGIRSEHRVILMNAGDMAEAGNNTPVSKYVITTSPSVCDGDFGPT